MPERLPPGPGVRCPCSRTRDHHGLCPHCDTPATTACMNNECSRCSNAATHCVICKRWQMSIRKAEACAEQHRLDEDHARWREIHGN